MGDDEGSVVNDIDFAALGAAAEKKETAAAAAEETADAWERSLLHHDPEEPDVIETPAFEPINDA